MRFFLSNQIDFYISLSLFIFSALNIQVKPVESVIEAGAQVHQALNIECVEDFKERPALIVQFTYAGQQQRFDLLIPLTINKFFEPTVMGAADFFARWKKLEK